MCYSKSDVVGAGYPSKAKYCKIFGRQRSFVNLLFTGDRYASSAPSKGVIQSFDCELGAWVSPRAGPKAKGTVFFGSNVSNYSNPCFMHNLSV